MREYSADDIKPTTLLQSIIKRPRMYTPHGTVLEVLLLIHGYQLAIFFKDERFNEIKAFNEWIDRSVTIDQPDTIYEVTQRPDAVIQAFGSDQAFFDAALQMLEKFHSDSPPAW